MHERFGESLERSTGIKFIAIDEDLNPQGYLWKSSYLICCVYLAAARVGVASKKWEEEQFKQQPRFGKGEEEDEEELCVLSEGGSGCNIPPHPTLSAAPTLSAFRFMAGN